MDFTKAIKHGLTISRTIYFQLTRQKTVIAQKPQANELNTKINSETIAKLERLSLVEFGNEAGIKRLEAAIQFAQKLKFLHVDDSVEPLYCVLEKENLRLRDDSVTEGNCQAKILKNAAIIEEEYFVAPQGNIPLQQ